MKTIHLLAALLVSASLANAAAVGSRGGKKDVIGLNDRSGYDVLIDDEKPWKVFESTDTGRVQVVDENGVAPKQGMVRQICISSVTTTDAYVVIYDSNTVAGNNVSTPNIKLGPQLQGATTKPLCLQLNVEFTSGLVIEISTKTSPGASGSGYVYWRELTGEYK